MPVAAGDGRAVQARRPPWLDKKIRLSDCSRVEQLLRGLGLNTVCSRAACPNIGECFGRRQATVMILGRNCTRGCAFCNVGRGEPEAVDPDEPRRVALAVKELGLRHAVITSVTRDDLEDGGSGHFGAVVGEVRRVSPGTAIEALIPDFSGRRDAVARVVAARPRIVAHNVETVPRLYHRARPDARYRRSLGVLLEAKRTDPGVLTKSGIMLGLGERDEEVRAVMRDLRAHGVDFFSAGQYLAPGARHLPVAEFIAPDRFAALREYAVKIGFRQACCGPYVRSSYRADEYLA